MKIAAPEPPNAGISDERLSAMAGGHCFDCDIPPGNIGCGTG